MLELKLVSKIKLRATIAINEKNLAGSLFILKPNETTRQEGLKVSLFKDYAPQLK